MGKIGVPGGGSQTIKNGEKSALSCTVDRWGQIQLIVDGVDASLPNLFIGFSLYVNLFGVNSITIIVSMYSMTIHDDRYHSLLLNCCNIKKNNFFLFFLIASSRLCCIPELTHSSRVGNYLGFSEESQKDPSPTCVTSSTQVEMYGRLTFCKRVDHSSLTRILIELALLSPSQQVVPDYWTVCWYILTSLKSYMFNSFKYSACNCKNAVINAIDAG